MPHPLDDHPLRHLLRAPRSAVRRASSWDRTGGNADYIRIASGETATLLDEAGAGCINRMAKLTGPAENLSRIATFADPYYRGEFALALERLRALELP